ncbi:hypothetical protein C4901_02020 [Acidiferrobacter sp. SPIII_3]|jgi:CRISPR-associated protein Cmr1|uniref:hypothetical protein n=1 Tax=Acidiferrobacter sp. SPIII_3 TaxID=1281578 RepID=UPI000D73DB59|nr:hypothetical protein [Acidiferrobacter sp. SPIII_3]AWP22284.1 hypothetical protein C4901_02020 [Acidiferrobacter sp. SPIII_3]
MMKKLEYTVRFITPAFLGNAEQAGQWRTPPFKALLRQWWRVAYAADHNFDVDIADMRQEEGLLFGHAWLESDHDDKGNKVAARKSQVRMRLDRWGIGKLIRWQGLPSVLHPEVHQAVGSDLYLGYGPLTLPRGERQPKLKAKAAIQAGESARISLAVPDDNESRIGRALWLMHHYGTLGGRSRNGWGSLSLEPENEESKKALEGHSAPLQKWTMCLNTDWPCAIGQDERALIWQTQMSNDWKDLMKKLAEIKIGLRTQFRFPNDRPPHRAPLSRHWLSYPITRHQTSAWDGSARLPNALRFKARPTVDGKVIGVVVHVPHLPPAAFQPDRRTIENVWQRVHAFLDDPGQQLTRIPE